VSEEGAAGGRQDPAEESVGRNTLFSFATQMTTAAGTAVLTLYLVRALGPVTFGVFSIAVGLGALVLLPSDFGITHSAARFIAERRHQGSQVAGVIADAVRLKLIFGAACSAVLFAAAGPIADAYGEPSLGWPVRWVAIVVFFQSMMSFYRYAFSSLQRVSEGFKIVASESVAETGASIAIVILAGGAAGAAAGRAAGYGVGLFVALLLTYRAFGQRAFVHRGPPVVGRKTLLKYAGALLVIDAAFALSSQAAPLLIGGVLGARSVGVFQAPSRLIVFLQYPGIAIANAVTPRLARREGHEPDVGSFTMALRHILVFQALLMAPAIVWAEPITRLLLGPGYEQSAGVLRALAPYIFTAGIAPIVSLGVNYLGEARLRLPISILDVVLELGLTVLFLHWWGLLGAAYATDVGALLYVPLHLWILKRLVDLPLRPLALGLVRSLTAAAAMALVLFACGTHHLSILEWIVGAVGGFAAFVAVLLLTRQVTVPELRALWGFVRRRLPGDDRGREG
jgi:O-antigen/teichoic acid export membrane protein